MGHLFSYSIEAGIILILLYIAYKFTMAGERQFSLNRIALYSMYAAALTLPAAFPAIRDIFSARGATASGTATIDLGMLTAAIPAKTQEPVWPGILLLIYVAGVIFTLARLAYGIFRIVRIATDHERRPLAGGYILVLTDRKEFSPFSFMRYIVISREDYARSRDEILIHEMTHLRKQHWIDQLLANLLAAFMWYNPVAWLMIEEMKSVHEYQADNAVIDSGTDMRQYQYLLIEKAVGKRFPSPANSLNHSNLKKRVTMMYKSKPSAMRRLAGIAVIPAAAAALALTNIPAVAEVISETKSATLTNVSESKVNKSSASVQTDNAFQADGRRDQTKVIAVGSVPKNGAGEMSMRLADPMEVVAYKNGSPDTDAKADGPRVIKHFGKIKSDKPLEIILDGKVISDEELENINPDDISIISVDKDQPGQPDRIRIQTKENAESTRQAETSVSLVKDIPTKNAVLPEFPGGMEQLMMWLANNLRYPQEAHDKDIEGKVVVSFTITKEGKVRDASVAKSVSPSLDAEALRIVGAMPDWTPGKVEGENIDCSFSLPINFRLQRDSAMQAEH